MCLILITIPDQDTGTALHGFHMHVSLSYTLGTGLVSYTCVFPINKLKFITNQSGNKT